MVVNTVDALKAPTAMVLHRRVYLTGTLVAGLALVIALVALLALVGLSGEASTLVARDKARSLLGDAQLDVAEGQAQFTLALSGTPSAETKSKVQAALTQRQTGASEWKAYKAIAQARGWLPVGSDNLTRDLARLLATDIAAPGAPSAGTSPSSTQTTARVSTIAEQVQLDFATVRSSEQGWWAVNLPRQDRQITRDVEWLLLTAGLALVMIVGFVGLLARVAQRRDVELAQRDRDLAQVAAANEFEARLQRALELAATEDRVFSVVEQALGEAVPELSVEMMLADSSRAHFQQLVTTGHDTGSWCSVESPANCPAAQRGEVLTFESSRALDACPYLKDQSEACSAVCVPVSVSGLTVGVVHAAGTDKNPPGPSGRVALELVARRASDRIGMMRAFSRSETQATTDPLTGLLNRRALENAVRRLTSAGTPYAVAFADLDHFKAVNDNFGHNAGDRALRVFARVLKEGLRPHDLCGRYGGEEFVIVLPECDETDGIRALERIREQLAVTLLIAECPSFTVSFGLALSRPGELFESVVATADSALLKAKQEGRDRVIVAGPYATTP